MLQDIQVGADPLTEVQLVVGIESNSVTRQANWPGIDWPWLGKARCCSEYERMSILLSCKGSRFIPIEICRLFHDLPHATAVIPANFDSEYEGFKTESKLLTQFGVFPHFMKTNLGLYRPYIEIRYVRVSAMGLLTTSIFAIRAINLLVTQEVINSIAWNTEISPQTRHSTIWTHPDG
jgi:hypothetical protein